MLNLVTSTKPKCLRCPLNNEHAVQPVEVSGRGKHKILLLFKCPDESESDGYKRVIGQQYIPIVEILSEYGISFKEDCWKLHAVNCHYSDRQYKNPDKLIENCSNFVEHEIKRLKPDLIIAFGGEASKAVLKNRFSDCSVSRWRGIPLFVPEFNSHLMVTFDPGKFDNGMDGETYRETTSRDVKEGLKLLKKEKPFRVKNYGGFRG